LGGGCSQLQDRQDGGEDRDHGVCRKECVGVDGKATVAGGYRKRGYKRGRGRRMKVREEEKEGDGGEEERGDEDSKR
jgi:hypothetical protein